MMPRFRPGARRGSGIRSSWLGLRAYVTLLLSVWMVAAPKSVVAQEGALARGNELYQEGDFARAARAFETVYEGGYESADLHYNLGNAYFKAGQLGRAVLSWERALKLDPGQEDARANLELADGLIADDIEPLPRFWLLSVVSWWVNALPRSLLLILAGGAWLTLAAGASLGILSRSRSRRRLAGWLIWVGAGVILLFGTTSAARELGLGRSERGVVMVEAVPVRSAPAEDDNLTLFEVHEGTRVRIDQRTEQWAEIVLADGKVGWVPVTALEVV